MQLNCARHYLFFLTLLLALSIGSQLTAAEFLSSHDDCVALNTRSVGGSYNPGVLEEAMICRSISYIDIVQIKNLAQNRISSFKKGDTTAIREFDLTIDNYVLNTADDIELELGQMMLKEIAKSEYDVNGRYRFLLGVSYLNSSCDKHQNEVLRTLNESACERNLLAAALLAYIYQEGYQCFSRDPIRRNLLLNSYEKIADSNVSFDDAIKYMKGKGVILDVKPE